MDLSVADDGTTIHPSTGQSSVNAAVHLQDLACAVAQSRTPVSAAEVLLSNDGKSVSSVNIDGIDHSQTASQLKGEVGISLEPLPDVSSLPDSSDLVWNDSLNQGDSDLNIQIQSACSIDMNVFEQMSSLSGKQTGTGTGSCDEFVSESTIKGKEAVTGSSNCDESICAIGTERKQTVTGTSNCDASISEAMMEVKQTGIGANSTVESVCETMTKSKQSATGIRSCDVYFAEITTTEACKVVDSISTTDVIESDVKVEEFACAVDSVSISKTRDLSESKVDCHLTCSTFPECDSTQQLEFSVCQSSSNEAGNSREVDEISNHASDSKDENNFSDRSPPGKNMNIVKHSDAETRNSEAHTPLARLVESSKCVSSEVQGLASATKSHSADAMEGREGDITVKDVTCAGARNVHENTEAETSCEKTDLSSVCDSSANDSTRSDADSVCGKTEPKLNDSEEKERCALGENARTKINDQELPQDKENCVDVESKMDVDENAAETCISVDSSAIESDSSTKDPSSDWNPIIIPTLQSRGSNHPEYRKPLLSSKYQPATKKGSITDRWGNERQRGWQGAPNQGPVPKRPTLGDIVAEAESGKNRVPTLMDLNEGGNEFYHHQAFNNGDQQRPWNDGPEHRPPFSSPSHWNNPPPPGYMSPFDNGMPQPGPFMSLPPPGPGMPPPGMPPPGIPPPGIPPPGMPPPGMPVPPPGMLMPPSGSMPGPPPVGGMFMPPPPFGAMEPPGGMPWNPGMPPPPNSLPQPFNLPPPSFMPPPNMLPPGCMAPPGSVPPPYGMPPAGMFPPQYDPTQFPPGGMTSAPPYIGQYQNYGANPLPGNYSGMPVQPDQEWYDWWQRYSQWTQQCNSTTATPTWTYETPVATATMLPTSNATPSSTSHPQTDKAKPSSSKTTATSKEKNSRAEKESVASISLPPPKQKLNWIETKPPKPTSHNRLPNLTSLVAHFHSDSKSKNRSSSPTKEAEPKDPGSSENMLWIGNLPVGTRAIELRSTISEYGKVSNCKVGALKSQKDAGLFGLVTMETAEDAEYCIRKLNNSIYNGQSIIVKKFQKDN